MCRWLTGALFLLFCRPFCAPAQTYWQQQTEYRIEVTLNDVEHTLDAFEKIVYQNNSPDTLRFIWFHLWPNAYRNDRTAFSEQLLLNNRTDFYFAGAEQRGYINRLRFEVNGTLAQVQDHPQYIDVVKLLLPQPLPPGAKAEISTPFHVQLPANFSRGGHTWQSYQVTQWYPKPAVYDRRGWHEMPYLDQGEFYSEFGSFDVTITVPQNYVVAATGELQNQDELQWLQTRKGFTLPLPPSKPALVKGSKPAKPFKPAAKPEQIASSSQKKTLHYLQSRVHDFAWFADKRFRVDQDTIELPSKRVVRAFSYYLPEDSAYWKTSLRYIRQAVLTRSAWLGEYPYETVSAVEAQMGFEGGMEYPTITSISPVHSAEELETTLVHEVSHNWLYGVLATNERDLPWMDEGMNTYYDGRYAVLQKRPVPAGADSLLSTSRSFQTQKTVFETFASVQKDQPIATRSEDFSKENYSLVAYFKAGEWMRRLEQKMGRLLFDSCMRVYYTTWKFRHPYPEDFRQVLEQGSGLQLDSFFQALNEKGSLDRPVRRPELRLQPVFPWVPPSGGAQNDRYRFLSLGPSLGFNLYDGLMVGGLVHNYQLPVKPFQFLAVPMYATRSKKFSGLARASYTWYPGKGPYKITAGAAASLFSISEFKPDDQPKIFSGVRKFVPFVRLTLHEDPLSKRERWVQLKSYWISEDQLQFSRLIRGADTSDVVNTVARSYYINQLRMVLHNDRTLYPYSGELQVEQHRQFVRTTFTGRYYFNYVSRDGGLGLRFFAGKFAYLGGSSTAKQFETDRFQLNMTGARGNEDYTYSDYFVGRNRFDGFASQQIMVRDGGFKVRTDLLSNKVGKTDNWLMALNLSADIPKGVNPLSVFPVRLPIKVFADIGTSAGAWNREANSDRFLFDAGFELSLFKETVHLYVPVVYSRVYRDYFRSTLGAKRFWKILSFSIDLQNLSWRKLDPGIPF